MNVPAFSAVTLDVYYDSGLYLELSAKVKGKPKNVSIQEFLNSAARNARNLELDWQGSALTSVNKIEWKSESFGSNMRGESVVRHFGWCVALNGEIPDTAMDQTFLTSRTDHIDLFWSYIDCSYRNGGAPLCDRKCTSVANIEFKKK